MEKRIAHRRPIAGNMVGGNASFSQALIVTHKSDWRGCAKFENSTLSTVFPAEAGIQWHLGAFNLNLNPKSSIFRDRKRIRALGSRLRGNDELTGWCSYLRLQWSKNLWVTISAYRGRRKGNRLYAANRQLSSRRASGRGRPAGIQWL